MKYQLKPRGSFEARQLTLDNIAEIAEWCKGTICERYNAPAVRVLTIVGTHVAVPGDWILKGIGGYCDIYDDATFHQRYEPVREDK